MESRAFHTKKGRLKFQTTFCLFALLGDVLFQQFAELRAGFRMFQAVGDGRFEITQFAAAVLAFSVKGMGEDKLVIQQAGDAVGQLDFVARAARQVFQKAENARGQNITTDHGKVGRRFFGFRFLNDIGNSLKAFQFFHFNNAVRAGLRRIDGFHA